VGDAAILGASASIGVAMSASPAQRSGKDALWVNEVFGPTVQGEGLSIGVPAVFVRLAHCPLRCTWCDTPYSWNWSQFDRRVETHQRDCADVWDEVANLGGSGVRTLVITGGEPAMQARTLGPLLSAARAAGWSTEMETSGVRGLGPVSELLDVVTVSPKLASSGNLALRRLRPAVLAEFASNPRVVWKFVVDNFSDLDEVDELVARYAMRNVFVMPQATTREQVLAGAAALAAPAEARGYRVSTRLHILLWGNQRGR
jgi:7-carboxy-7-deazaguanine synthase